MPPAPASHGSSGAAPPKPACTPQSAPAPINPSRAGRPSRKNAEKDTITIRSIRASVATSPASAAAATVIPLAVEGPAGAGAFAAGAGPMGGGPAGETGERRNERAPPAAPSGGNNMKPSIPPIAAQYAVTAATKANTGSRSQGAGCPNRLRKAMPAAIQNVTQTVLTTAPGKTSSQMSEGSSTGV